MSNPVNIFFIYARADQKYKQRIINNLSPLIQDGTITVWSDEHIPPGADWEKEIRKNLNTADVILALVSGDFLGSSYIQSTEMLLAFERHEKKEVEIIPIILGACLWESNARLKNLQALPDDGKPVNTWSPEDNAYLSIALGVKAKINEVLARRRKAEEDNIAAAQKVLQQKEWEYAQSKGTVTAYMEYVQRFQLSPEQQDEVEDGLTKTREAIDYTLACVRDTKEAYEDYLKTYKKANPLYEEDAKRRMQGAKPAANGAPPRKPLPLPPSAPPIASAPPTSSLSRLPDWAKYASAVALVLLAYRIFRPQPESNQPDQSELAWKKTLETGTKKAYDAYRFSFPNGKHFNEAGDSIQAIQNFVNVHIQKANNVKFSPPDARAELKLVLDRDPDNAQANMLWEQLK